MRHHLPHFTSHAIRSPRRHACWGGFGRGKFATMVDSRSLALLPRRTLVFLAGVLLLTSIAGSDAAAPNLLLDPGAEDVSLRHWEPSGVAAALGEQGHTGWNSLRLKVPWTGSSPKRHQWSQILTSFTGDVTEFFLGAWIRVAEGDAKYFKVKVSVKREGDHWSSLELPVVADGEYGEWTYLYASREVSSKIIWAEIKATVDGERNKADIWIDDIAFCAGLKRCSPDPVPPGPTSFVLESDWIRSKDRSRRRGRPGS